jgi:hypothetical protein
MSFQDCSPPYDYRPDFTPRCSAPGQEVNPDYCILNVDCAAPVKPEVRSRLKAGNTLFRSKGGGVDKNNIHVELVLTFDGFFLNVYVQEADVEPNDDPIEIFGPIVQGYPLTITPGETEEDPDEISCATPADSRFREIVNLGGDNDITPDPEFQGPSAYIEMPELDHGGVNENSIPEDPEDYYFVKTNHGCLEPFPPTRLEGGNGPPATPSSARTGPERSIVILSQTEVFKDSYEDTGATKTPPDTRKILQWDGTFWIPYIPNEDCLPLP